MKQFRSPQEKKVFSYAKDGRNTIAEARSKSRKSIAKRKAAANRALRRAETVVLSGIDPKSNEVDMVVVRSGRKSWRKIPDAPLSEYVGRTLGRRVAGGMNKLLKKSRLLKEGKNRARSRAVSYKDDNG